MVIGHNVDYVLKDIIKHAKIRSFIKISGKSDVYNVRKIEILIFFISVHIIKMDTILGV